MDPADLLIHELKLCIFFASSSCHVEYLKNKYANIPVEDTKTRAILVLAALEDGRAEAEKWVQTVPAVEILLANEKQGLRQQSFREEHEPLWSSFVKVAPELMLHLAEVMLSARSVSYMRQFAEEMKYTTGCSFTRTHCLAENGMVLRILSRNLWELKYLIKWLGLSKSDLASVGVPWPV